MAPAASDDESEPFVVIVALWCPRGDGVVPRVEREEGYADRVDLLVARGMRVVRLHVREGKRWGRAAEAHGDERVEADPCQARLLQDGRKRLGETGVGELVDRVEVTDKDLLEIGTEAFGID